MEFIIQNKELEKIDNEIYNLNKTYSMAINSLNSLPNIYAAKEIISKIKDLEKRLLKIKPKNEFEKLIIENNLKNFEVSSAYLEYFTTAKKETIDSLIKKVLGKDSLEKIKKIIKDFDYKKFWEYYLSYQEYTYRQIPSDEASLQDTFRKILIDLKKDLVAYAIEHFNFPKNYEFDLILGQPYSQNTFFHPTNRRMEVSPSRFFVFKENEIKINVCGVIEALFHELIGHGRHEINSALMPKAIKDDSINIAIASAHIHGEGIAQITRQEAIEFMRLHKEKYQIKEDYIKQIELSTISDNSVAMHIFYQYLRLKKMENPSIKVEKEFEKITNNKGLAILYSTASISPISIIKNATYPIGKIYITEILDNLKKEIGEKKFKQNHAIINQAISIGLWHFDILPKFVKLYLKEKKVL